MNRLKAIIRSIFAFSRSETNAFLILLPLMVLIIFSEPVYRYWVIGQSQNFSKDSIRLDSLVSIWKWRVLDTARSISEIRPFHFNPNKATNKDFLALGFSKIFASRVINYRSKGGTFYQKSDLLKMYGVDSALYQKLYSFIDLPKAKKTENKDRLTITMIERSKAAFTKADLNVADTTELMKVYGIGKKRSEWIVKYRSRLGGFISMDQLKEVYGLDSTLLNSLNKKYFIQTDFMPHQIPINKATVKELSDHPYLSYKLANAIVAYRFQHGSFQSMDDLVNIRLITEADIKRIKPYLTLNP